jgi:hypothetical protein
MKPHSFFFFAVLFTFYQCKIPVVYAPPTTSDLAQMNQVIDAWHAAAAHGDSTAYFALMTNDAVFLGTDAMERWTKPQMQKELARAFDGKEAWTFLPHDRYYTPTGNRDVYHFDESLKTWMGPCRGSGLMKKVNGKWMVYFYNLANTVPNQVMNKYIELLPVKEVLLRKLIRH